MAKLILEHVRLAGVCSTVPAKTIDNLNVPEAELQPRQRLVRNIGIRYRRICDKGQIFSDLAESASQDLLQALKWDPTTVDLLIVVTQSPEYPIPGLAIILQDRLGMAQTTAAFDINLGCSGFPYALSVAAGMMQSGHIRRALVVAGDQAASEGAADSGREILFGDAGCAAALEYDEAAKPIYFEGYSDGANFKAIYTPHGGKRRPLDASSLVPQMCEDGIVRKPIDVWLDGPAIMNFSLEVAPKAVHSILDICGLQLQDIRFFLFHQANRLINDTIRKKLGLTPEQVPETLSDYGNTSSATIPITISSRIGDQLKAGDRLLMCGFGIGLSWGSMVVEIDERFVAPPVRSLPHTPVTEQADA
jgi:3-oxoacyl-[acyl-carrier-protein] synthase-3